MTARRAFTLLEMLIVLGIIITLMGLLLPIIVAAMKKAPITKTWTTIHNIESAVAQYHVNQGLYPEPNLVTSFPWTDSAQLNANNHMLLDKIRLIDRDSFHGNAACIRDGFLADAWGSPLAYRSFTQYPSPDSTRAPMPARATNDADVDSDDPPKADSYQLWSFGPNRINEAGAKTGGCDDIANWHSL